MKKCCKCGETKELGEFSRDKRTKDGRYPQCKVCRKKYYQANREKIAEWNKQHYQANREKLAEYKKQHYQANREKIAERHKRYRQANREMINAYRQKRRARERNADGNATAAEIQARFDYHGNRCYYCGCDGKMTIEHRIPLSRGGTHYPANIVPACPSCNSRKGTKTEKEFVV
jgi:5-methylcytosine-specific restriction endonuclease McrA